MHDVRSVPGLAVPAAQLERTLAAKRLPPTWLLCGPEGTGKWALAAELARALLCAQPTPWGCGTCAHCKRVLAFGHSDLFLLFGYPTGGGTGKARARFQAEYTEGFLQCKREAPLVPYAEQRNRFIPAERVSELLSWSQLKPSEGSRKVALVYEPELIVRTVVDKLLKLIEEPPPDTSLILVSHRPESLPQTIRSRARQVSVKRMGPRALTQYLEASGHAPSSAAVAARQARGAVGFALASLAEGEEADPQTAALDLLAGLMQHDAHTLGLIQLWQWKSERTRARETLEVWAALVRDVACAPHTDALLGGLSGPWRERLAALAEPELAEAALDQIRDTQAALDTNVHIGTALCALSENLARLGAGRRPTPFWPRPQMV
jgi:DNA polymerase-3 subunit delta'